MSTRTMPKTGNKEQIAERVEMLRAEIAKARAARTKAAEQRRSRAACAEYVDAQIDAWRASGERALRYSMIQIATGGMPALLRGRSGVGGVTDYGPLFVALLGPDALRERLISFLNDAVPEGFDAEVRGSLLGQAAADLDRLETEEETLIVQLEAADYPIQRRRDARPEIVLSVA